MTEKLPKIEFSNMTKDEVASLLAWTALESDGPYPLSKFTFEMYPEIKSVVNASDNNNDNLSDLIKSVISGRYDEFLDKNKNKPAEYNEIWSKYSNDYMIALSERLNIKWPDNSMQIKSGIGEIPVFPRDIKERYFNVGVVKDEFLVEIIMHECSHFLFFEKWKRLYPDWRWDDFESPSLIWHLSEMLVDPILNCEKIKYIFDQNFYAYDSYYCIEIDGRKMMDYIKDLFNNDSIENAILNSYEYVLKNEKQIREQCG